MVDISVIDVLFTIYDIQNILKIVLRNARRIKYVYHLIIIAFLKIVNIFFNSMISAQKEA